MSEQARLFRFIFTIAILTAVAAAGYFVFLGFMQKSQLLLSVFPLAVAAGAASFFSPCVFPLLPAVVTTTLKAETRVSPLFLGFVGGIGVLSFLLILGLTVGIIGDPLGTFLQENLRIIRGIIGIFLIYLAFSQLSDKFHLGLFEKFSPKVEISKKAPIRSVYLYGFGYTLAGSGCTVPILGGLTLGALASGGFQAAFGSFSVAAATMATLMFVFFTFTGYLKSIPENITSATPRIKKVAGVVLLLVGIFYIGNAIFKFI